MSDYQEQKGQEEPAQPQCPVCGGSDITANILVSQNVQSTRAGLCYKIAPLIESTEPLLADLCTQCGTVIRFHVENTDRKWKATA